MRLDDKAYMNRWRPFRPPEKCWHRLDHDVICMLWQVGLSLAYTEVIDLTGIVTMPPERSPNL